MGEAGAAGLSMLGVLVTGEPLTWNLLVGAATVLVGVAILEGRLTAAVTVRLKRK